MPLFLSCERLRVKGFRILLIGSGILLPSLLPLCLFVYGYEFENENNYFYAVVGRKFIYIKAEAA